MKYSYEIKPENKTIIVKTIDNLITKEVAAMELEILLKAKELKYKVIFDLRFNKNRISIGEAYFWYSTHNDYIEEELRDIPAAYISNTKDWAFYTFFECTCNTKGIPIKVFRDENAVHEWFKEIEYSKLDLKLQPVC